METCSGGIRNNTKPLPKNKCKKGFFDCGDNTCIPDSQFCDGVDQCKNGRDEVMSACCAGDYKAYDMEVCNPKTVFNETESELRPAEIFIKTTSFRKSSVT